ncbi:unnamed protein product [Prunus armeniaca]
MYSVTGEGQLVQYRIEKLAFKLERKYFPAKLISSKKKHLVTFKLIGFPVCNSRNEQIGFLCTIYGL